MASSPPAPLPAGPEEKKVRRPWKGAWRYGRALAAPLLIWGLLIYALSGPLSDLLKGQDRYDQEVLLEWLTEARNQDKTLADLLEDYLVCTRDYAERKGRQESAPPDVLREDLVSSARNRVVAKRQEIYQYLRCLGEPATKLYPGQLPLFPVIYRLEVVFRFEKLPEAQRAPFDEEAKVPMTTPIAWASGLPSVKGQYKEQPFDLHAHARVIVRYQLHAFNKRQRDEQDRARRLRELTLLAVAATLLSVAWVAFLQGRERDRERQRLLAEHQMAQAERLLLQEEARRAEAERQLLEQRLATQAAERQALELKSHLYASIGIMAGSYAHNIKNLLVRPNDLLRRCLEADGKTNQDGMLREVQQTLGMVTERLQQILQTVRRDPNQAELRALDLNDLLAGLGHTWRDLAADRWKLDVVLELEEGPLEVEGDVSHLQQAVENLLFNARDATFEMRNNLRDSARRQHGLDERARRQAVLAAAGWRGKVVVRTRRLGKEAILEVSDNGAGMTEEVRQRCTETHYSTKRDNALYEGHSTGMGLGLSFVVAILMHHHAKLEIESVPLNGTTFRARFPLPASTGPR